MALALISDVRALGNLPASSLMPDDIITPQLDSAARELESWIGDYSSATGAKRNAVVEAECCITMAYLIPVLNTFYTHGAPTIQKEIGEMDFMFHNPEDAKIVADQWMARAKSRVRAYAEHADGKGAIGWYAI